MKLLYVGTMNMSTTKKSLAWMLASVLLGTAALSRLMAADAPPTPTPPVPAPAATVDDPTKPFQAFPPSVDLTGSRAYQAIVCKFTQPDGVTRDVTGAAQFTVADPKIAKIEGHTVKPLADGSTTIYIKSPQGSQSIPLTVKNATIEPAISFKLDVMPVFMRNGCNVTVATARLGARMGFVCRSSVSMAMETISA